MSESDNNSSSKVFIITGGTRGIGFGLARELLRQNQKVVICGRSNVESAVYNLGSFVPCGLAAMERVRGTECDISKYDHVEHLWRFAVEAFEHVDVFVNNAALSNGGRNVVDCHPDLIRQIVDTNLTGSINCCRVAMFGMRQQPSGGRFYLFEGNGSDGRVSAGHTLYACTKSAVRTFMRGMQLEAKGSNVRIGCLQPGMVTTNLLMDRYRGRPEEFAKVRRTFNILAEHEETTTPWLAQQLIAGTMEARYLTPLSVIWRFLKYGIFIKRDLFADDPEFN